MFVESKSWQEFVCRPRKKFAEKNVKKRDIEVENNLRVHKAIHSPQTIPLREPNKMSRTNLKSAKSPTPGGSVAP